MKSSFPEDGDNSYIRLAYLRSRIDERLAETDKHMARSNNLKPSDRGGAESAARDALLSCARALDWAEDSDREEETHRRLDLLEFYVRTTFGCRLGRHGTTYSVTCPVHIGHRRIGLSIGGRAQRVCSLCGIDVSECAHLPGRAYIVNGGPSELGWCRVCCQEKCDHKSTNEYRVAPVAIVQHVDLEEVSIVSKPAQPEARFSSMPIATSELVAALGPSFVPGQDVSCDRCLTKCNGLSRFDFPHG